MLKNVALSVKFKVSLSGSDAVISFWNTNSALAVPVREGSLRKDDGGMRQLNFPVFDGDHHLYETEESFTRYLPEDLKDVFRYITVEGRTKVGRQIRRGSGGTLSAS